MYSANWDWFRWIYDNKKKSSTSLSAAKFYKIIWVHIQMHSFFKTLYFKKFYWKSDSSVILYMFQDFLLICKILPLGVKLYPINQSLLILCNDLQNYTSSASISNDNARACGGNSSEMHIHQTNQGTVSTVRRLPWTFRVFPTCSQCNTSKSFFL